MITKQTKIGEILQKYGQKAAEILMGSGMGCIGCPGAQAESLEDGCKAHGLTDDEITVIVKKIQALDTKSN